MRLIDADKLKEEVLKWLPSDTCGIEEKEIPYETDIVVSMMLTLEDAPSIDICFCRECKFSEVIQNDSSGVMARYCRAFTIPMMRSDDDYCSYGERKESER